MKPRKHLLTTFSVLLIAALLVACVSPAVAPTATTAQPTSTPIPPTPVPPAQQAEEAVMQTMDLFFEAYRIYDMDKMLSLHTDDTVWTWIDPGKNLPILGPEGKWRRNRERRDPSHVRARPRPVWLQRLYRVV